MNSESTERWNEVSGAPEGCWREDRRPLEGHFSLAGTLTLAIDGADSRSVNMLNNYLCSARTEKKWRRKDELVTAVNKAEKQAACLLQHRTSINYTKPTGVERRSLWFRAIRYRNTTDDTRWIETKKGGWNRWNTRFMAHTLILWVLQNREENSSSSKRQ